MVLVKTNREKLAKRILPFSILVLAILYGEVVWLDTDSNLLRTAAMLLVVNGYLMLSVGFMPGRAGLRVRACLGLAPFAVFVLLPFRYEAVRLWTLPVAALYVAVTWGLSFFVIVRYALRHFVRLRELQDLGRNLICIKEYHPTAVHATDIHLTASSETARVDGGTGGHAQMEIWLEKMKQLAPAYVLVSGDIVDTGDSREWKIFNEHIEKHAWIKDRLVLAPGNHDLSPYYGEEDLGKLRRYIEFQSRMSPTLITAYDLKLSALAEIARAEVAFKIEKRRDEIRGLVRFDSRFGMVLMQSVGMRPHYYSRKACLFAEEHGAFSMEYARSGWQFPQDFFGVPKDFDFEGFALETLLDDWFVERWHEMFPFKLEDPDQGLLIIVLNSVASETQNVTESALGGLGNNQLSRLGKIFECLPNWVRTVFIMTHHAPFRRSGEFELPLPKPLFTRYGWQRASTMISELAFLPQEGREARGLIDLVADLADRPQSPNVLVLCGHRHRRSSGRAGRAIILEGGSLADQEAETWVVYTRDNEVSVYPQYISRKES